MILRKQYESLLPGLENKLVFVLTGMRRVGKSTAVRFLLQQAKTNNKLSLDCERIEIRALFNIPNYQTIIDELELLGFDFSRKGIIALDEVQLVPNLPSFIKYVYDTYGTKFIITGSSSYYLKNNFSESLAGRKRIFELTPLTFLEFLQFRKQPLNLIQKYSLQPYNPAWFNKYNKFYEEYIRYGGFPEVVLQQKQTDKRELLRDIINSYIEMDVKLLSDYSVSEDLYKLMKLMAARTGSKTDYSKLSSVSGLNRFKVKDYLALFASTYLLYEVKPFTKNIDREISTQPKFYFSDTGILNELADDKISSGQLFENAIAAQLKPMGTLQYYQKKTGQEIDFIVKEKLAVEVKETALAPDANTLLQRSKELGIKKRMLVGRYVPKDGFQAFFWGGNLF
ncbi:MAG: ATP-binding protein [Flavobacteriales bacterium]|nr:ATP-binding protein [Flavobacteriales bacterium]